MATDKIIEIVQDNQKEVQERPKRGRILIRPEQIVDTGMIEDKFDGASRFEPSNSPWDRGFL